MLYIIFFNNFVTVINLLQLTLNTWLNPANYLFMLYPLN